MQSCFLIKGSGYSVRAWILAGSAFSYLFPTTKLGKTRKGKNSHFSGFTYSLFFKSLTNPSLMCWICVSASLQNIKKNRSVEHVSKNAIDYGLENGRGIG